MSSARASLKKWWDIVSDVGMVDVCEREMHPHVPEEKPELFHVMRDDGTEFEVMNLLHALTTCFKFEHVLETGTQYGYSTLAIASALEFNGRGRLTTVEMRPEAVARARALAERWSLAHWIDFRRQNSSAFVEEYDGPPFDFVFLDSELGQRVEEFRVLYDRAKISGLVSIHDTSRRRGGSLGDYNPEMIAWFDRVGWELAVPGLESHLSRGFRVFQMR
ncbi:MAG: O-methyltransferase [Planctomycetota bacterium]